MQDPKLPLKVTYTGRGLVLELNRIPQPDDWYIYFNNDTTRQVMPIVPGNFLKRTDQEELYIAFNASPDGKTITWKRIQLLDALVATAS